MSIRSVLAVNVIVMTAAVVLAEDSDGLKEFYEKFGRLPGPYARQTEKLLS